ncbi:hypothetical protein ACIQZO_19415 [Streptomyces sp. NPDC097617]|uniref:hypothetical protein n=1 Tax=Streptomyces sp. NPDC097617 TaxID=3366091 RepID=UPI003814FD9B
MPPSPSVISSLNADQAAAAGSLVRLLADRFDTLPTDETTTLAQALLTEDGLVADIQNLLRAVSHWAGTTGPALYTGPLPFEVRDALREAADQLEPLEILAKETVFPMTLPHRHGPSAAVAPVPRPPAFTEGPGWRR